MATQSLSEVPYADNPSICALSTEEILTKHRRAFLSLRQFTDILSDSQWSHTDSPRIELEDIAEVWMALYESAERRFRRSLEGGES